MDERRVLVLPGTSSPAKGDYVQVYSTMKREADRRGYECRLAYYPGHRGKSSGVLSFESAAKRAAELCDEFKPSWIISRSFGCVVAAHVLSTQQPWVEACNGAVLWGPGLNSALIRQLPTREQRREKAVEYREWDTFLAPDLFDNIPPIENLVRTAQCNLRFARGSQDQNNVREELDFLASLHRRRQPEYLREVVEIGGLKHVVDTDEVSSLLLKRYYNVLFDPITSRS